MNKHVMELMAKQREARLARDATLALINPAKKRKVPEWRPFAKTIKAATNKPYSDHNSLEQRHEWIADAVRNSVTARMLTRDGTTLRFEIDTDHGMLRFWNPAHTHYENGPTSWASYILETDKRNLVDWDCFDTTTRPHHINLTPTGNANLYRCIVLEIPGNPTLEDIAPSIGEPR